METNLDVHLICDPMVPFSATPTSSPSRLPVLLFSWLGKNTVEGGAKRSMYESDYVFISVLHSFAVDPGLIIFKHFPVSGISGSQQSSPRTTIFLLYFPSLTYKRLLAGLLILLDRCLCWLWLLPDGPTNRVLISSSSLCPCSWVLLLVASDLPHCLLLCFLATPLPGKLIPCPEILL